MPSRLVWGAPGTGVLYSETRRAIRPSPRQGNSAALGLLGFATYTETYNGDGAVAAPIFTVAGDGTSVVPVYTGTGTVSIPIQTVAGAGTTTVPQYAGAGAVTTPVQTVAGTGVSAVPVYSGAGAVSTPIFTVAGAGVSVVPSYLGAGGVTIPVQPVAGAGTSVVPVFTGAGAATIPMQGVAGAGVSVVPSYIATGGVTIPIFGVAGTGVNGVLTTGDGAVTIPVFQAAGAGSYASAVATGPVTIYLYDADTTDIVLRDPTAGESVAAGAGAVSIPTQQVAGGAFVVGPQYVGAGAVTIPIFGVAGTGVRGVNQVGAGGITIPMLQVDGHAISHRPHGPPTDRPVGPFEPGVDFPPGFYIRDRARDLGLNALLGSSEVGGPRIEEIWNWRTEESSGNGFIETGNPAPNVDLLVSFDLQIGGKKNKNDWSWHE